MAHQEFAATTIGVFRRPAVAVRCVREVWNTTNTANCGKLLLSWENIAFSKERRRNPRRRATEVAERIAVASLFRRPSHAQVHNCLL